MRVSLKIVICGVVLAALGSAAWAGFAKPEEAIRYRKAVMTIIGQHFGRLAAVVKGQSPYDKQEFSHQTMVIRTMTGLSWEAFLFPGSDKGDTTLKASALKEKDSFMRIARNFEKDMQKMDETAATGDLQAIRAQFGQVAKDCKACHSTYRKR